jgi:hypothetical protein
MCEFLSFKFETGKEQPLRFAGNLSGHEQISGDGYECEWIAPDPDSLTVRLPDDVSDHIAGQVREWILARYSWQALIDFAFREINLTVGGSLDLRGTAITALPDNLTVGGWLYLRGTAITALPDNLTVGGTIYR